MTGTLLRIFCLTSALFYFASFILNYFKKSTSGKLSTLLWVFGIVLNGIIVVNNWIVNGYMPFVSMYQVLTFLSVTFSLVYLYIRYIHDGEFMKPYFIITQAVIMTGVSFMAQNSVWHFPPALQSAYFIPHVFSYMISYSLVAVAAIMCIMEYFINKEKKPMYNNGVYQLILTGFPFMVLGLFLGALWANACWGNYWAWDNKEVWSLVTIFSLCIYLHFRRHESLKKYASVFVIIAFACQIITLLFVGMFSTDSPHAYS